MYGYIGQDMYLDILSCQYPALDDVVRKQKYPAVKRVRGYGSGRSATLACFPPLLTLLIDSHSLSFTVIQKLSLVKGRLHVDAPFFLYLASTWCAGRVIISVGRMQEEGGGVQRLLVLAYLGTIEYVSITMEESNIKKTKKKPKPLSPLPTSRPNDSQPPAHSKIARPYKCRPRTGILAANNKPRKPPLPPRPTDTTTTTSSSSSSSSSSSAGTRQKETDAPLN
ncbi:hypothetical protein L249_0235 [Ophiocordyceps polyrhachis-furcata BCC 54312]|uniref:Uncharacterized protein n=1 Tax=Ophiocordyceps polyrhachis-furcata BCC 54312 TaxID=1330021 RepID=A0A367LFI3_9HYPO|nr:hypothetical protein L249_0235 [Ophiocordyceps polyrhachis-furcata BCC 54312]